MIEIALLAEIAILALIFFFVLFYIFFQASPAEKRIADFKKKRIADFKKKTHGPGRHLRGLSPPSHPPSTPPPSWSQPARYSLEQERLVVERRAWDAARTLRDSLPKVEFQALIEAFTEAGMTLPEDLSKLDEQNSDERQCPQCHQTVTIPDEDYICKGCRAAIA